MILQDSLEINSHLDIQLKNLERKQKHSFLAIDSSTQMASVAYSVEGELVRFEECFRQRSHSEWVNEAIERVFEFKLQEKIRSLDFIALINGPGSFTGLRVASNVAKVMAYSLDIPILTKNSLEILAYQYFLNKCKSNIINESVIVGSGRVESDVVGSSSVESDIVILPMINAFKNCVFCGLYKAASYTLNHQYYFDLKVILPPTVVEVRLLNDFFLKNKNHFPNNKVIVVGEGFEFYKELILTINSIVIQRPSQPMDFPLATTLVQWVNSQWKGHQFTHWNNLLPIYLRGSAAEEAAKERGSSCGTQ